MKNLFFLLSLFNLLFAGPIQDRKIDPKALLELTSFLGVPEGANLIEEIQNYWLRPKGLELWETLELPLEKRLFILSWAEKEGFFSPWEPADQDYDTALILGATVPKMKMELDHLKELWDQKVHFKKVVFLTGDRPLDARVDTLLDRAPTEFEASKILWEEADLPEDLKNLPVLFVQAPMKEEGGSLKRPSREDTLWAWLTVDPTPCKALFVSAQPFCGHQFEVIKTVLPDTFLFDVVGRGVNPNKYPSAAVFLDSLARWIYQEQIFISRENL